MPHAQGTITLQGREEEVAWGVDSLSLPTAGFKHLFSLPYWACSSSVHEPALCR